MKVSLLPPVNDTDTVLAVAVERYDGKKLFVAIDTREHTPQAVHAMKWIVREVGNACETLRNECSSKVV